MKNYQVSGARFQVSAQPPAKKTAGLIEKETDERRTPDYHAWCIGLVLTSVYKSNHKIDLTTLSRHCGQVERRTSNVEHRTSNIERRINVFYLFKIRLSEAIPSFVIRYSAVRFFIFVKFHISAASGLNSGQFNRKKTTFL